MTKLPMPEQPVGKFDGKTGKWTLTEAWAVRVNTNSLRVMILHGFKSDGASIPRWLWPVVGPRLAAKTFPAALLHDALYESKLFARWFADAEFYRLLVGFGAGRLKARLYWLAVRVFGGVFWKRISEQDVKATRHLVKVYSVD
jgi:hypothetical protein